MMAHLRLLMGIVVEVCEGEKGRYLLLSHSVLKVEEPFHRQRVWHAEKLLNRLVLHHRRYSSYRKPPKLNVETLNSRHTNTYPQISLPKRKHPVS